MTRVARTAFFCAALLLAAAAGAAGLAREALKIETGSLYPALHRLEKRGWVAAEWKTSENKQRAKYYKLTASGRRQLANEQSRWTQLVEAMTALMKTRRA